MVVDVVAIHTRHDDIIQTPLVHGVGRPRRLLRIQGIGPPRRLDGTEPTPSSTRVAHDHYRGRGRVLLITIIARGGAAAPAFPNVRAPRLLADRRELLLAYGRTQALVVRAGGGRGLEPRGLPRFGRCGGLLLQGLAERGEAR